MKRIIFVVANFSVFFFFLNFGLYAQTDADIRAAGSAVTTASTALRPFQKFSENDSLPWLFGGDASLSLKATYFTEWAAGGEDQIGTNAIVNLFYNYKKGIRTFENYATLAYGFLKTGENDAIKSDDHIQFTSKAGQQFSPKFYYTATLLARTQFSPGYRYSKTDTIRTSDFLAPAQIFISVGVDYRPSNSFSFVLSPLMGKATFVRSDDDNVLSAAGMIPETRINETTGNEEQFFPSRSRYEFGGGALISFKGNLFNDRISYNSQVDLFSNYVVKPENIDVFWTFQAKIAIYRNISADFRLDLKYDDDEKSIIKNDEGQDIPGGPRIQTRTFFGLGLFYQF